MHLKTKIVTAEPLSCDHVNAVAQFIAILASEFSCHDEIEKSVAIIHKPILEGFGIEFSFGPKYASKDQLTIVTYNLIPYASFRYQADPADYGAIDIVVHDFIRHIGKVLKERKDNRDFNPPERLFIGSIIGYKEASIV